MADEEEDEDMAIIVTRGMPIARQVDQIECGDRVAGVAEARSG